MAAEPPADVETAVARRLNRCLHVHALAAACDEPRPPVDHCVPYRARRIVARISRDEDVALECLRQVFFDHASLTAGRGETHRLQLTTESFPGGVQNRLWPGTLIRRAEARPLRSQPRGGKLWQKLKLQSPTNRRGSICRHPMRRRRASFTRRCLAGKSR